MDALKLQKSIFYSYTIKSLANSTKLDYVPKRKDFDIDFNFLIKIKEKNTLQKTESDQKSYHVRKIKKNA